MDLNKKAKVVSSTIKLSAVVLYWKCSVEFGAHRRKYAKSTVIMQQISQNIYIIGAGGRYTIKPLCHCEAWE